MRRNPAPILLTLIPALAATPAVAQEVLPPPELAAWLAKYPEADEDGDGRLTAAEHAGYLAKARLDPPGAPPVFEIDPGWERDGFPADAVCHRTPEEIEQVYRRGKPESAPAVVSHPRPEDGSLRIVGTGHSFMVPGYRALPAVARAAGLSQPPPYTHVGGGITGSARYKWEQENGIFGFAGRPTPKLLASIANARWDVMMWGSYYNDRPQYYSCWIDFCLEYNPGMKFYVCDSWPQLRQLAARPTSPGQLTADLFRGMGDRRNRVYAKFVDSLRTEYPGRVFVVPTSDAMVLAVESFHEGRLPGVEGIHTLVGGKERSLWRDAIGHLGPAFANLEGYVFYATLYGRSPELIEGDVFPGTADGYPGRELDRAFRRIAWRSVARHPLSGVTDVNGDGLADR